MELKQACRALPIQTFTSQQQRLLTLSVAAKQEETNTVTGPKPYREGMSGEGSVEEQAEEAWQYCRSRSTSALQGLFTGQSQTQTTCTGCGHCSLKFDEFQSLTLSLPRTLRSIWTGLSMKVQVSSASSSQAETTACSLGVKLHNALQLAVLLCVVVCWIQRHWISVFRTMTKQKPCCDVPACEKRSCMTTLPALAMMPHLHKQYTPVAAGLLFTCQLWPGCYAS